MNDFREFSEQYNDYICHAASTGHTTKKGDKNLISTEDPKEPPKHYAYRLAQSGWSIDQVKKLCERSSNAYDSPANHKYWAEVLRIFKENYVQHSCNDFREYSDYMMHYGIKGMHWGIRRYQNPDGTLTELGKKHLAQEEDAIKRDYQDREKKLNKRINKAKDYLSMDKDMQKEKKVEKFKRDKKYAEQLKKTYKEIANKELEKIKNTPIDDLAYERSKRTGQAIARSILTTGAVNATLWAMGIPFTYFEIDFADKNFLTKEERQSIINKNMKNVATARQRDQIYRSTSRI